MSQLDNILIWKKVPQSKIVYLTSCSERHTNVVCYGINFV